MIVVFATIAMVPQKSLFETYVHEYAKQASHGCIHAEPVHSQFFFSICVAQKSEQHRLR